LSARFAIPLLTAVALGTPAAPAMASTVYAEEGVLQITPGSMI